MSGHVNANVSEQVSGHGSTSTQGSVQVSEQMTDLLFHPPAKTVEQLGSVVLAYIGDAVFELLVRQYLIARPNHKLHHLHREATSRVSAKAQCAMLEKLAAVLTEEEADVVRRGRNAKSGAPPKNADHAHYRQATGLEALIGYLYYKQRYGRLQTLLEQALDSEEARIAIILTAEKEEQL